MELSYGKLPAAITLLFVTLLSSLLPVVLVKKLENESSRPRNIRVVSFLSCFGGGVFMATCLLHLFPDVKDQMVLLFKSVNLNPNYPVAEFILSVGFLIVLITEQIVLNCQENGSPEKVPIFNHEHSHAATSYQNYGSINENHGSINENHGSINEILQHEDYNTSHPAILTEVQPNDHEQHSHEISFHQDLSSHSILRSLLLVFALSLHSIFEGLAIGLQSSVENVIKILVAVLIHKCVIAFTLGLNLTHSKLRKSSVIKGILFFSLTSPVGVIIGLVVVDFVTGLPMLITSGILQGLAAGTFLYVTFFEVLPHELNSSEDRIIKMGCLVFGFSVVSVLLIIFPN